MASSSSSSCNWAYDVFPSFRGEDVRVNFLSHFLKEFDRKFIITFKDNELERSGSLDPELKQAIRTSKIAVVVFSEKYPSSSWCLDELLEIVKCKKESGQLIIPIFYGLDPSHVRRQTGKFGETFAKTCQKSTEYKTKLWQQSLTDVANVLGYHSQNWHSEAKMIEAIANDVLGKLNLTPSKDFEDFVGMEDHNAKMGVLLNLESDEVRMVGIWGSSGIGKTTIARVLYSQLSHRFQGSVYVDRAFVSKSKEIYNSANPDDYNMKLHLLRRFLSKILNKKDTKIDRLDAMEKRLKHQKVLIFIDDLEDQAVLDTLAGQTHWFGCGSRIIVITKDKQFLRAHGINYIYEVCLPSDKLALEMFCRYAFRQTSPPYGLMELASEVVLRAGNLPLGLKVLGSYLRGRKKEDWVEMLPSLRNTLNGKIERTLIVGYDGLNNRKEKELFRHIACLFNGEKINDIKILLANSKLDVNIGLKNLVDKSLIHVRHDTVEMHGLLEDMGKEIVRAQSNEPGEREFLVDSKDICDVLEDNTGTNKVLGITLDMDEIDELHIDENAFKKMRNLFFLKFYTKKWDNKKEVRWHLPEGFDYLPHKLRLLRLDGYPMRCMPLNFRPENLIKLQMSESKLERLWEGVHSLGWLKEINLQRSKNLEEIPNLSMATNLEKLDLSDCSSLVELPSSIKYLNKLEVLFMSGCINLETLPRGINLQSLYRLDLCGCSKLKIFPDISTNISQLILNDTAIEEFPSNLTLENLDILSMCRMKSEFFWKRVQPLTPLITMLSTTLGRLILSDIPNLVELPSSIQNLHYLKHFWLTECINLETLPNDINFQYLYHLNLTGCTRLKAFPDISTNISQLYLTRTGIEEVPWWTKKFFRLQYLNMNGCNNLKCVSLHISELESLLSVDFSDCRALTKASWNSPSDVVMATVHHEVTSSFPDNFINCFNYVQNALVEPKTVFFESMMLSGEDVPSYFTHRISGTSMTNIPLPYTTPPQPFFRFKACVVVDSESSLRGYFVFFINVSCRFRGKCGYHFALPYRHMFYKHDKGIHLVIFECSFPLRRNYYVVDIRFHLSNNSFSTSKLKGCGIRLM